MAKDVRINFYDLFCFLIRKKYLFILDSGMERIQIAGKSTQGGIVAFVSFSDPPIRRENVFVPPFKLEELRQCFGINPQEL